MPLVDLLEGQPAALLHEVDEAEVARAEHDHVAVGDVVLGLLRLLPGRFAHSESDHGALLVPARDPGHLAACQRAFDELVEAVPVALLERRSLGLPVVGEDDDLVRPWRIAGSELDLAEVVVELPECLEGVGPLEARVVRHLVVARERRVDRGAPAHEVGEDAGGDQVAHEDAQRAPHQRVDASAVTARLHVAALRPERRRQFEDDLPAEQDERAGRVVAVRKEGPIPGVRLLFCVHPADGEDHLVRLAREKVSPAGAAVDQKADARRTPPLDLRAIGRCRARHHRRGLLLHPSERGDVFVRAQEDPRLAGARLRREIRLPLDETVRVTRPAGHVRGVAVPHRPAQHGQCEPVDLEEDDPGNVGGGNDPLPAGDPLRDADRRRRGRSRGGRRAPGSRPRR